MKFGKEFASQMVPEWQEAYLDYDNLKSLLKEIQVMKQKAALEQQQQLQQCGLKRARTLYRAFSGLMDRPRGNAVHSDANDVENQAILVSYVKENESESYQTAFFMVAEEGAERELVYFRKLDHEFNKVDKFYRSKVQEMINEAEVLSKQMDALIAFRVKADQSIRLFIDSNNQNEDEGGSCDGQGIKLFSQFRPASVDVLDQVKLKDMLETPRSTLKSCLNIPILVDTSFSKENLKKAEKQLKKAFAEFYSKLQLLKNFSFLNILAISKIMKKYDKITLRNASRAYMKMVDDSYLGSSDEVMRLIGRVEATFIKHFANSNRSKAMSILRPIEKKERHKISFSIGLSIGCTLALILALALLIHARDLLDKPGQAQYMDNMFPLYSLFAFVVLHMLMYAANIYFWRLYRINYPFIFNFKQGTELGYRDVLLFSFGLAVLALASVLSNLDMEMDPETEDYEALTELIPLCLVVIVVLVLVCPFNIVYRSSRFFFITCVFHCICAPLYKVALSDFFLADQLTSQVQAFRSLEFYVCYYSWGDYKLRRNTCQTNDVFNAFYFIVAVIPYWCRLLQCLRRFFEEKDKMQAYNGLKYFFTIAAVCTRTAYSLDNRIGWKILAWVSSATATIHGVYWDLAIDWGLLQFQSKNRLLRDKLLVPYKSVYFGAMVLNVLLRFAWLQTVLNFQVSFLHRQTLIAIVASLEIIRRGIWNFFRLENEHLNNVGKYRAFKTVPLPFHYTN